YLGCYTEPSFPSRALSFLMTSETGMTPTFCIDTCQKRGYTYAGAEWSKECWCGNELSNATLTDPSKCSHPCSGNTSIACGGSRSLQVYGPQDSLSSPMPTPIPSSSYGYLGCYAEPPFPSRALSLMTTFETSMTPDLCIKTCQKKDYQYAGAEWSKECWCGNDIYNATVADLGKCNYPCSGNSTITCGGSRMLQIYE
ncbi:carbohydrate-binding WSC, partial [Thozetella sp. PMI_491]